MTLSFLSARTLFVAVLSFLTLLLLSAARPACAATATINDFMVTYSPSHGSDTVPVNCTCTYTTPGLSGHWTLYNVITGTDYSANQIIVREVLASGDYASGQVVSLTQYPNGSYEAVQDGSGGAHRSYHYELFNEVWDTSTYVAVATADKTSLEQTIY